MVAERLNYHANSLARSLKGSRTNVIGVFYGFDPRIGKSPFLLEIISGLQVACSDLKLDLLLHTSPEAGTEAKVIRKLCDGRNDGLILASWPTDQLAELIVRAGLPSVALVEPVLGLPLVTADGSAGARLQLEHLAARGHKKLLALFPNMTRGGSVAHRLSALEEIAREMGVELAVRTASDGPDEAISGEDLTWLKTRSGPTGIVCWADETADLACSQLLAAGISVPGDVAVVGFNGMKPSQIPRWDLTTVEANWQSVAYASVQRLEAEINDQDGPLETQLPVRLRVGSTT